MDTLYKQLEEKNRAAEQQFREKLKKHAQLQKLYDKLKNKTMAENLEGAAEMDADNALHNVSAQYADDSRQANTFQHPHGRTGSGHSGVRRNTYNTWNNPQPSSRNGMLCFLERYPASVSCFINSRIGTFLVPPAPTHNRQRFATHHNSGNSMMGSMRGINPLESDYSRQGTPFRQPLGNLNPNVQGSGGNGFGQGMSAGLKMGRQQSGPYARSGGQAPMQKCSGELGAR